MIVRAASWAGVAAVLGIVALDVAAWEDGAGPAWVRRGLILILVSAVVVQLFSSRHRLRGSRSITIDWPRVGVALVVVVVAGTGLTLLLQAIGLVPSLARVVGLVAILPFALRWMETSGAVSRPEEP